MTYYEECYGRLPRRAKKEILGKRIGKQKLFSMLKSVVIKKNKYPESDTIEPFPFCPKCGCGVVVWHDHGVPYPERWESGYCGRCGFHVAETDNSPYYHALSCENYEV